MRAGERFDDSGRCPLAKKHKFIPLYDEEHTVGICCTYCGYTLFEHKGTLLITPGGEMIVAGGARINGVQFGGRN